jgi:hypothetical protein
VVNRAVWTILDRQMRFFPKMRPLTFDLKVTGSPLMMAVTRTVAGATSLWTCQHVGLESDGSYYGGSDGASMTRSGIQWLKLSVNSSSPYLSHSSGGRIFDTATSNP